jgi:hypothetical protein
MKGVRGIFAGIDEEEEERTVAEAQKLARECQQRNFKDCD